MKLQEAFYQGPADHFKQCIPVDYIMLTLAWLERWEDNNNHRNHRLFSGIFVSFSFLFRQYFMARKSVIKIKLILMAYELFLHNITCFSLKSSSESV